MHRRHLPPSQSPRPSRGFRGRALRASAVGMVLLAGLTGCGIAGNVEKKADGNDKPVVLTTFTVLADMARNISGDHVEVRSITSPGAEIHEYEPTPDDIKQASQADLVLENGMHLETWFEKFTQDAHADHVTLSEGIEPINITEGDGKDTANPHAWMSPQAAMTYVDNMVKAFSRLSPEHAEDFKANAEKYRGKIREIQERMTHGLSTVPEDRRVLVTCEGAFSYLARDAGLREKYLWAVNSDGDPTPSRIAETIDEVNNNKVPAVFCESTVSDSSMRQVVDATDAKFGGTLYVDSLSDQNGPVPTYLDLLRHDAETIASALGGHQ